MNTDLQYCSCVIKVCTLQVLLFVVSAAMAQYYPYPYAQPAAVVAPRPPAVFIPSAQYHAQNVAGGYNYGYTSGDGQQKHEARGPDGTVYGSYTYADASGVPVQVSYSAGPGGFQASGSHIPQAPALPEANVRAIAEHNAAVAAARALNPPRPQGLY